MEKCALLADRLWGHWGGEDQVQGGIQQQSLGTTHSQVISRTLTLGVRWSHFTFNVFDIPVFLPYYKSLVLKQTEADWQQEDVAEEPVEQQRHKLFFRSECCSGPGDQWHAWIPRERRRRHDVLPCSWKCSINKQLHSGQSSWSSSRRKCQKINIGKITSRCKISHCRRRRWPKPVGRGHAGGWGR